MLRVILTLDCDRCRQSYYKAAVSTDLEAFFWESHSEDLKSCAGMDGWYIPPAESENQEIFCDECVEAMLERSAETSAS